MGGRLEPSFLRGDANADGAVDALDYSFIVENFLEASKDACCPGSGATQSTDTPITSITVKGRTRKIYTSGDVLETLAVLSAGTKVIVKYKSGRRFRTWTGALADKRR